MVVSLELCGVAVPIATFPEKSPVPFTSSSAQAFNVLIQTDPLKYDLPTAPNAYQAAVLFFAYNPIDPVELANAYTHIPPKEGVFHPVPFENQYIQAVGPHP
jgi:hypothetical protein